MICDPRDAVGLIDADGNAISAATASLRTSAGCAAGEHHR